jgi:hypothetical protein
MRIRRTVLAAGLSLGLAGLAVSPATGADSTVVVGRTADMVPTHAGFLSLLCNDPGSVDSGLETSPAIQQGPDPVPLGTRTWGFPGIVQNVATGPYRTVGSMSGLSSAQVEVHADESEGVTGVFVAGITDGSTSWVGLSAVSLTSASGWTTEAIDKGATTFSWMHYDDAGHAIGSDLGTIAHEIGQIGGDRPGYVAIAFGCDTHDYSYDDVEIGDTGDVVTYDLDASATTTSIQDVRSPIVAGDQVTLKGVVRYASDGSPLNGVAFDLQAKPAGTKTWKKVGSGIQTIDGGTLTKASKRVHPQVTTSYRWVYPETDGLLGSHSGAVTVKVRTGLPAKASDTSVTRGTRVRITGHTVPKQRDARVLLWRGSHQLDTARTDRHGRFALTTVPSFRGVWKVYVTTPKSSGNLAGRSKTLTIRVR